MDIKKAIKARGWTQEKLAAKMGITHPSLNSIINGNPTLAKLTSLADAMGITVSELLRDGDANQTIICPHCGKVIHFSKEGEK
jgi:transcriptional regulator with XRE-family HTH domain